MSEEPANDPIHVRLYAHAVEQPDWTPESAAQHLGLTHKEVLRARDELMELHLFQPGSAKELAAVSPDVAVADRTHDDMERIRSLTATVDQARLELARLEPVYAAARQQRYLQDRTVEVLETPQAVSRIVYEAIGQCRESAYIMHPTIAFRAEAHAASKSYDEELVRRGVDRRNLYHQATTTNAATRRAVAEMLPIGVKFRVLPVIPVHAIIYDDALAIISRREHEQDQAALLLRDSTLVRVIRHVFESVWDQAAPFPTDEPETPQDDDRPSEIQLRILEGMAAGLTDEAVARRSGVHVRTLRRHLNTLGEQTGSDSRFQLALRARELGWI